MLYDEKPSPLGSIVCGVGIRYCPSLPFIWSIRSATGLTGAVVLVFRLLQSSCFPPAYVRYRESRFSAQNCAASDPADRSSVSAGRIRFDTDVLSRPFTWRVP